MYTNVVTRSDGMTRSSAWAKRRLALDNTNRSTRNEVFGALPRVRTEVVRLGSGVPHTCVVSPAAASCSA
jgi:hypothetical protein